MLPVKILWRSTNTAAATIDANGLAIAQNAGTTKIIGQVGLAADTATLVFKQVLRYVVVKPDLDTLVAIEDTSHFLAQGQDTASWEIPDPPPVTWASADTTIATVDQTGLVRARQNGLVLITASSAGQSGSAVVLVRQQVAKAQIAEDSVALTGDGATVRLTASGLDRNGYPVPAATRINWYSSLGFVATVDTGGLVTAHGDGRTRIQALPINGGQSDTATVIVTGAPQNLIAFDSPRGIEVVRADGTLRTVLLNGHSGDYYYDTYTPQDPAWSPDGTRLAFALQYISYYYANAWSIDVSSADGSIMTEPVSDYLFKGGPAWSPDGKTIAFSWDGAGGSAIYVVPAAGGSSTRLTDAITLDYKPAWSPDGKIALQSNRDGNAEIYVMNADGSGITRLTNHPGKDMEPAWSPDGSQLAFTSTRSGFQEIWLMNADGSGLIALTPIGAWSDAAAAWSPDGTQIVFARECSGCSQSDLYIVNRNGTGLRRLTTDAGAGNPTWRATAPLTPPSAASPAALRRRRGPPR
jgi:WD40 repeat protein